MKAIRKAEDDQCSFCNNATETAEQLFCKCPTQFCKRLKYLEEVQSTPQEVGQIPPKNIPWFDGSLRCTMISTNHPLSSVYIRSTCRRYTEEKRHLLLYPYMIHPFSMFSFWFHQAMNLCFFYIFIPFYYQMVINRTIYTVRQLYCVSLPFYVPLVIISFCTGYHDKQENRVVLNFKSVCWRYIRTYFFFDILFITGIYFVIRYYHMPVIVGYLAFFVLTACSFARYPYFHEGCKMFKMYVGLDISTYSLLILMLTSLAIFLFIFAYVFYQVRQQPPWRFLKTQARPRKVKINWFLELRRLFAFVEVVMMVGQSHNNFNRRSINHYTTDLVPILFIPLGFVFTLALAVRVMQIWNKYYSAEGRNDQIKFQFKTYMKHLDMPLSMKERIYNFLDFKYQRQVFNEKKVDTLVSEKLQKDILLYASKSKLEHVDFFKNFPDKALRKILRMMKLEFYMPGDIIIKAGVQGTCMFFISVGTVLVTTRHGKEICILKDGAQIGEIALITKAKRVANVVAVSPCALYRLKRQHFQQVMKKFPALLEKITEQALGRIERTKSLVNTSSKNLDYMTSSNESFDFEYEESDEEMLTHLL